MILDEYEERVKASEARNDQAQYAMDNNNHIQTSNNVFINSVNLNQTAVQGQEAQGPTLPAVSAVPAVPQVHNQLPVRTGPHPRYALRHIIIKQRPLIQIAVTVTRTIPISQAVSTRGAGMGRDADVLDVVLSISCKGPPDSLQRSR